MANLPLFYPEDISNKRVLVRVDLNAPIQGAHITDTTRLEAIVPTIKELIRHKAKIVLLAHRGRPKGHVDASLSLKILIPYLEKILGQSVSFCNETIGETAKKAVEALEPSEILLLENLRFHKGEETNDPEFAKALSVLGDVYINDGFAVSHRTHASTIGITNYLPSFAGLLLQKEVEYLSSVFSADSNPVLAIVGGSKISTKIGLLESLLEKVKTLVIGGGIANTFLLAQGYSIGKSLCEKGEVSTALHIIEQAKLKNCSLILPVDVCAAKSITSKSKVHKLPFQTLEDDDYIFDMGPQTTDLINQAIEQSKTILWNGPVGLFEHKPFDESSLKIAEKISDLTKQGKLKSIVGGGETVALIKQAKLEEGFSYLSTGGGAFLDYIENN